MHALNCFIEERKKITSSLLALYGAPVSTSSPISKMCGVLFGSFFMFSNFNRLALHNETCVLQEQI